MTNLIPTVYLFRKNKDKENCARCEKLLGIRKSKSETFWKFNGSLCNDCHSFAEKFTKYYDCRYIDGNPSFANVLVSTAISSDTKGKIILVLFDNKNDFIFTNKKNEVLIDIPIASFSSCKIETKSEKSLKKQLIIAGISKTNESRYLRIEYFLDNTKQQQERQYYYMLFDLDDKLEIVNTTINKFISRENNNNFFVDQTFLPSKQQQPSSSSQKSTTTSLQPSISSSSLPQQQQEKSDTSDDIFNYEYPDDEDEDNDYNDEIATEIKRHCKSCNHLNDIDSQFCSRCGKQLVKYEIDTTKPVNVIQIEGSSASFDEKKEKVFFKEKGELVLKRVEHRGSGRKVASWLVAGPIGYVLIGRDKTKNHRMKGTLTITNKAIYCSGNVYPYDHIGVISREKKSLILILDKQLDDDDHFSVTLYLKTGNVKKLSEALENARTSHLS